MAMIGFLTVVFAVIGFLVVATLFAAMVFVVAAQGVGGLIAAALMVFLAYRVARFLAAKI